MNTASPSTESRRWKRWTVIGLFIVALAATWWNWPRGDPRFCGTWRVIDEPTGAATGTFRLFRNGRGSSTPAGTSHVWLFRWTLDGDQLVLGRSLSGSYRDQLEWTTGWMLRATGHSFLTIEVRAEVVDVQQGRIRLREVKPAGRGITLERLKE